MIMPIRAVLLDFHSTLVDQGDAAQWLEAGLDRIGMTMSDVERSVIVERLDGVWGHARAIDPHSGRDHSADAHAQVFGDVMRGHVPDALVGALYDVMLDMWWAYDDSGPLLDTLRARGIPTAIVSNVGVDIRPVMRRQGLTADAVILSCEVGAVKPDRAIFEVALAALGVTAGEALMVGDSANDDGGAAALGIRTLILPRTRGRVHGLDAVLRLLD